MKKSRFTEEQIIGVLREQESGMATADVCRKHGISSASFYKWKAKLARLESRLKCPTCGSRRVSIVFDIAEN